MSVETTVELLKRLHREGMPIAREERNRMIEWTFDELGKYRLVWYNKYTERWGCLCFNNAYRPAKCGHVKFIKELEGENGTGI